VAGAGAADPPRRGERREGDGGRMEEDDGKGRGFRLRPSVFSSRFSVSSARRQARRGAVWEWDCGSWELEVGVGCRSRRGPRRCVAGVPSGARGDAAHLDE
jgi:hypothetical protein